MKTYVYENMIIKENVSEIVAQFAKAKPAEMDKILRKWSENIAAEAARDAPKDIGTLQNSIGARKDEDKELSYIVEDGEYYGIFQELGTSKGVRAKHFLGGATERNANPFFDDIKKALG